MSRLLTKKEILGMLKMLRRGIRHLFLHNGWMKLIAVLIALALWAGLISQDPNVTRNRAFQNVTVSVSGTDSLMKNKGLIVTSDLDKLLSEVNVVSAVPQLQYDDAEASVYNLRVNLSGIQSAGKQELKIQYTNSKTYGDVISVEPAYITVDVEEYFVNPKVPITVRKEGETPDGWYMTDPSVTPLAVSVSGPISIVKEVARGIATLDRSAVKWEEGTIRTIGEIKLVNLKSEEIASPLLSISSEGNINDSVIIEAYMMPTREYNIQELVRIKGEPAEGYQVTGELVYSSDCVVIASSEEELDKLDSLPVEQRAVKILGDGDLDITDLTETKVFELKVKTPEDAVLLSDETILVTVEITPVLEEETEDTEEP